MEKKEILIREAVLTCIVLLFFGTAIWFVIKEMRTASFICGVVMIFAAVKLQGFMHSLWGYHALCDNLDRLGKNMYTRAYVLYEWNKVQLYLRFAPKEETAKFVRAFNPADKEHPYYNEMNYIVEQIKQKSYGKQRV